MHRSLLHSLTSHTKTVLPMSSRQLSVMRPSRPSNGSHVLLQCSEVHREFVLQTDASDRGVEAVLSQLDDEGDDHPVTFFSQKLLPREEKYSTIEKECLAIKLAVQTFRVYLLGAPFVIQTDHRSLEWLDKLKENNAQLTCWSLALQPYQYRVVYRAGKANSNADALSRGFPSTSGATSVSQEKGGGV